MQRLLVCCYFCFHGKQSRSVLLLMWVQANNANANEARVFLTYNWNFADLNVSYSVAPDSEGNGTHH